MYLYTFVLSKNTAKHSYSKPAYNEFMLTTKSVSFPLYSLKK